MVGLIKEGEEMLSLKGDEEVRAAGIIVAAQKIEHYEIAAYGSLCAFARLLGRRDDLPLLEQSLAEEKRADATLTEIASASVNREAASTDARA
jgi:ferritin-like metal-binding protein YciE